MGSAKLDGVIAVPEVVGIVYVRRPAAQRLQVQRIFRVLNQNFHTREVHVHFQTITGTTDRDVVPESQRAPAPQGICHLNHSVRFWIMGYSPTEFFSTDC